MPQDWEPNDWAEAQASRVARQIKTLRGARSAQWLSDETAKWGYVVARATIADLENGRRRYVTTSEIAILAAALNVPPIVLCYPGPYEKQVEVLPGIDWPAEIDAVQWFSGIRNHGFTDLVEHPDGPGAAGRESGRLRNEYRTNMRDLQLWRELESLYAERSELRPPANPAEDENGLKVYQLLLRNYNTQIRSKRLELGLDDIDDLGSDDGG